MTKYTATVSTVSADASEPVVSYTGTLEELAQWGYLGDPASPALDPRFNPFNDDLYTIAKPERHVRPDGSRVHF